MTTSAPRCNLIFLSGSFEEPWLLYCLSALRPQVMRAYRDPWQEIVAMEEQDTLDVYYTNPTNRHGVETLQAIRASRRPEWGHGLLISGDENFLADRSLYHGARFVLRTHLPAFDRHPRLLTIPLGPRHGLRADQAVAAPHLPQARGPRVFFAGQLKYSRLAMARAFRGVEGALIRDSERSPLDGEHYLELLRSSWFALTPNGNATPDTYRFYEALEAGVVPIAERTWFADYFGRLYPGCPVPRFSSWARARRFVQTCTPAHQTELRRSVSAWWSTEKVALPGRVRAFVLRCLDQDLPEFSPRRSCWARLAYRGRGLLYLISLNSSTALLIRLRRLLLRLLPGHQTGASN